MVTGRETPAPACWAEPRPWSLEHAGLGRPGEGGTLTRAASATAVEVPDRLPIPGALRIGTDVQIVPLRGEQYALRGATADDVRRQAALSLLELGYEVQEETEPESGPVAGRWMLLIGGREGGQSVGPGRLASQGNARVASNCQGAFDLDAQGDILLEPGVRWQGSLTSTGDVEIGDQVVLDGNIDARGVVRLCDGATVMGRVRCSRIILARSARISGGLVAGRTTNLSFAAANMPTASNEPIDGYGPRDYAPPPSPQDPPAPLGDSEAATEPPLEEPTRKEETPPKQRPIPEYELPPHATGNEWAEQNYYAPAGRSGGSQTTTSNASPPELEKLELVLGVDQQESLEFLQALGMKRLEGRPGFDLDVKADDEGLILRRRESADDQYWERRVNPDGHPILESLRDLLVRLGPETRARAEVRDKGAELHLGPVDATRLPAAMREIAGLVQSRAVSSVQATTERKA